MAGTNPFVPRHTHTRHCKMYYASDAAWPAQIHLCRGTHTSHCKTYYLERFVPAETRDFIILKGSRLTPFGKPPPRILVQPSLPSLNPYANHRALATPLSKLVVSLSEAQTGHRDSAWPPR